MRTTIQRLFAAAALLVLACSPDGEQGGTRIVGARATPEPMQRPAAAIAVIDEMQCPESVLHDREQDVYFVSNINGGELTADGNGFISRIDAKTLRTDVKWIESGRSGVRLDAPKGMTIVGNVLYVSDVTAVRKFDRRSGAPLGEIPLPGATFINDLTNDGRSVYASDTGLRMGPGLTFLRTGTESIWRISNDRAVKIAAGAALEEPNGLLFTDGKLLVVTFGGRHLYELTGDGDRADVTELPAAQLDGIVKMADGTFLVSSWKGDGVYHGPRGGPFRPILKGIDAPADIEYDATRRRLLVPHSFANQVTIHQVH